MATLHIPDLPEHLYTQLQQLAHLEHRSLNEQVIALLEQAIQPKPSRSVAEILEASRHRRETLPKNVGWPDSTALIRENRDR